MMYEIIRKQPNSHFCFACGLKNNFGLKARFFETANGELIGRFMPSPQHQGYPGRLHGGFISTILDEVLGRSIMVGSNQEFWGVTVELNVRFDRPIPLDAECRVVGRVTADRRRLFEASGEIILPDGQVAASATGRFIKLGINQITGPDSEGLHWAVVPEPDDPVSIQLVE